MNAYHKDLQVTETAQSVSFGFKVRSFAMLNVGTEDVYVRLDGGVAAASTSNSLKLEPGDGVDDHVLGPGARLEGFSAICAAGKSSTLRVYGSEG